MHLPDSKFRRFTALADGTTIPYMAKFPEPVALSRQLLSFKRIGVGAKGLDLVGPGRLDELLVQVRRASCELEREYHGWQLRRDDSLPLRIMIHLF
jgi:hypothetical protein